jgi:alpha-galactosidase
MDPLAYWRHNDAPDRRGITEMKYVEGLYAFWDRIAAAWPEGFREECASGGRRIDLETVMRFHVHQKTDYWFDDEVDQASLFSLSRYLPNNVVVAHLNRLDTYSFRSTLASSLCLGWIADAPDFDAERGARLLETYREIRPLLVGAWYPLLPYSRRLSEWMAWQHHRADLGRGVVLAFRRAESPYRTIDVGLKGLRPDALYRVSFKTAGRALNVPGRELSSRLEITIPERRASASIVYEEERR